MADELKTGNATIRLEKADITDLDMLKIFELTAGYQGIADLQGLEYCLNLDLLDLSSNLLSDASHTSLLALLPKLRELNLNGNELTILPDLSDLTLLKAFYFIDNPVTSLMPLSGVTSLTKLAFGLSADMEPEIPSAYISDISEYHGGLDFSIGDNSLGEAVVAGLKKHWIGQHEKNYKLITESKDNKKIYRTTHLFRIPEVRIDDIVIYKSLLYKVLNVHRGGVVIKSLRTYERETTTKWDKLMIPSRPIQEIKKIVISEDYSNSSYLLMDLNTYENEEVDKSDFPVELPVGNEISLLVWEDRYYLPFS